MEEEFRNVLAMIQGASATEAFDAFKRCLTKRPGVRTRIVQHLTRRDGRHVYPTLKSQYDPMFIKIAKGLHYHEFGVPAGPEYQAWARLEPSDRGNAYRNAANVVTRGLTPSFNFSVLGDSDVSIWWLEFAAGPVVLATLQKPSWRADDGHAKLALARIR